MVAVLDESMEYNVVGGMYMITVSGPSRIVSLIGLIFNVLEAAPIGVVREPEVVFCHAPANH